METFFPFVVIILVYLITNIRKQMKKREKEASKTIPRPTPPQPAIKRAVPTPPKIELEVIKEELPPLDNQETPVVSKPQPRIKTLVGRLRSKKDLILLSEILKRNF